MKNKFQNKKVFVGMSGGVDSSVTATLLQKDGYDVIGVFIKVWQPDFVECQWREDRLDAMRVCAKLGISFLDLDLEKEYKKEVFDYMIEEYKKGRTPNPDVMCNKKIKFGAFLDFALKNGADYIATGHYVRLKKSNNSVNQFQLLAGVDKNKDQSYFLWTLTQEQLKHCLFPVGGFKKSEVRKLAKKFDLINAQKKDSQGLCFVGKVEMKDFLGRFISNKKGDVLSLDGKKIGEHDGVHYYTLGQRHGFRISEKGTDDQAYYIVAKDLEKNTLTVAKQESLEKKKKSESSQKIEIEKINWILGKEPDLNKKYKARIRYRQILQDCKLFEESEKIFVNFEREQVAASSGQSIVLYDGELCLGGGVIL